MGTFSRRLIYGIGTGLIANFVAGRSDKLLSRFVSPRQKEKEHQIREGSPHEVAGKIIGRKIAGRELTSKEGRLAQLLFSAAYGAGWGMIYSWLRHRYRPASRFLGVPFAVPFFFACDGLIAPKLRFTPPLRKLPWQPSAKEMMNHVTWTASAEVMHRLREKAA
jgi:uncharacterized membrane protein YagU involved in acid resistance